MSTNRILALGAGALLAYFGFYFGLQAAFPCTAVGYDTAVSGRVTGAFQRKESRTFFLNGKLDRRYDFDAFGPATGPAQKDNPLSQYLRKGDLVSKPGRAAMLTVQRGDTLTRWACAPSPAIP